MQNTQTIIKLCFGVVFLIALHYFLHSGELEKETSQPKHSSANINCGVGSIFMKDGKVLVVFRNKTELNNNKYGLIGGLVKNGESVRQGAMREIFNEVGVIVKPENLTLVHTMSSTENGIETIGNYFLVEAWEGEPFNKASHKHSHIEWLDLERLPSNIIPRNKQAIDCMRKKIPYSEYGWQ